VKVGLIAEVDGRRHTARRVGKRVDESRLPCSEGIHEYFSDVLKLSGPAAAAAA